MLGEKTDEGKDPGTELVVVVELNMGVELTRVTKGSETYPLAVVPVGWETLGSKRSLLGLLVAGEKGSIT